MVFIPITHYSQVLPETTYFSAVVCEASVAGSGVSPEGVPLPATSSVSWRIAVKPASVPSAREPTAECPNRSETQGYSTPFAMADRRILPMNNGQVHIDPRTRTLTGVQVLGSGSYVPDNVVSNLDLQDSLGFDPEWIVNRTGIHERRFALPHQATSDLCTHAAIRCLKAAGRESSDIDLLVVATFTPDMAFPATANLVQDRLKLACPAFDVQAACAGFVFALVIAAQFVGTGNSRCALVVGGDCNSRVINPKDQKSFPLFGDGAGAVLLAPGNPNQGLLAYQLGSDGSGGDLLSRPACGSRIPPSAAALEQGLHYLTMDGRAVFKWAVRIVADSSLDVLAHGNCQVPEIRWF